MKHLEITFHRPYFDLTVGADKAEERIVQAFVKEIGVSKGRRIVVLTRKKPAKSPLGKEYTVSFNGELMDRSEPFPVVLRGIWFEHPEDLLPKYVLARGSCFKLDGKACIPFFDASEFTRRELFRQEEVHYEGFLHDGLMNIYSVNLSENRVFCCRKRSNLESVEAPRELGGGVSVVKVHNFDLLLAPASEIEKRWYICQYPEGEWERAKALLAEAAPEVRRWTKTEVYRLFDQYYLPLEGLAFKIARVPSADSAES